MEHLKRWLGVMGLASIIGFTGGFLLPRSMSMTARTAILGLALLAGIQIFHSMGWGVFILGAIALLGLTWINSFPAMNTATANISSWVGIVVVALAVWAFDRSRRKSNRRASA